MIPLSDANRSHRVPYVNVALIIINILVYFYEVTLSGSIALSDTSQRLASFFYSFAVIPLEYTGGVDVGTATVQPVFLTLFSAMFMHGGLLHLGGNMLFLWVFGDNIESNMGHVKYIIFYLLSGVIASFAHIAFNASSDIPSLGASGAIAGVLAAYLVLFPRAQVKTLLVIFFFITVTRVSALLLIGLWFALQFFQGIGELGTETAQTSGVAVWAHIGGFIAGLVLVLVFRGPNRQGRPELAEPYGRTPSGRF